ncbi:retrovirus-related pol polyprotein from transposon TNT 1-94 [Tanacetum coccineum]
MNSSPYKFKWTENTVPVVEGNSTVDACPNACEMWKSIERLKQGELINVQDLETNLYWEFGKFTSRDGESLESYYSRFYKMMNELLQPEWKRFVTLVKQSQELKTVSYHKLYDILKRHQNEVNEIRNERLASTANPLTLVAQQQPDHHPQNHPNHHTQNSSTKSQQTTRNRGKAIVNSSAPIYDQEPATVTEDDEIRANQDNSPRINRGIGYENQRVINVAGDRENVGTQIQEVTPDVADIFGPIFDAVPFQKVQYNDDNYNVFAIENKHPEQPKSVNETYMEEQGDTNITIDSLDIFYDREHDDHDDTDELAQERDLLASLIEKLKCEIDDSKNRNKFLESSNKALVDKLKDLKKFQAELDRYHDVNYASKVAIDCAKAKGDLMSYKIESEKSSNEYTRKINDLNQTISDMKKELFAHQETISIMSQEKEAQIKFYKTREDKELDKVIALENKVKVLDDIVYKTGQSVQTMNMLNRNCKTSFAKPEFLKKAQRANPRLYDIGCYNDNLALMLAPESDETIRLDKESRSKLSDLIRPFDYDQLNNLYDLEYYYADHMNAILGVYTELDEVTNLQCDYLETLEKCEHLEKELSNSRTMSKTFEALQKHAINLELDLQLYLKAQLQDNGIAIRMYKVNTEPNQTRTPQLPKDIRKTNKYVSFSTGVIPTTSVSRPHLKSNRMGDRVMPNNSQGKKQEVEDHHRNFKFSNNKTSVTACNDSLNAKTSNVNFVCVTCGKCVLNDNHDMCVIHYINGVNSRTRHPIAVPISTREPKLNVNQSVATSHKKIVATDSTIKKPRNIIRKIYEQISKTCSWWYPKFTLPRYKWKSKSPTGNVNPNVSMPLGNASRTANILEPMTPRCSTLSNTPLSFNSFAARTVKFRNDQIAPILGYGDLVQGTITIKKVAFRKSTCYIRDLKENDLLTGSRGTDLYFITLQETTTPNLICLMAKATSSEAWLWHRRLSYLNFDTINLLSKNNIVIGLPKLKFIKDHLCSSCELGKAKRKSFHIKTTPSSKRRLL